MRESPAFSIGIIAAALCCLLTPAVLTLLGLAGLPTIVGELVPPLLIGVAALAALAPGLRVLAHRRRSLHVRSRKKA